MSRLAAVLVLLLGVVGVARAEVDRITFVRQFGIAYTPLLMMEADRLIETHAERLGLAGFKVDWKVMTSGAATNDGLLSGQLAFGIGAPPAMLLLWDKTRGTANAIRGVVGVAVMPTVLVTSNPAIRSLRDFGEGDRIAVPAVRWSNAALALQMASAATWGADQWSRLDRQTVALPHPDAAAQVIGRGDIRSHFASPPYDAYELRSPQVHKVLSSVEVMGRTSLTVIWTTERFAVANPRVEAAVRGAVEEALETIRRDPVAAADRYLQLSGDKIAREDLLTVFADPEIRFEAAPQGMMVFAQFMQRIGALKAAPADWRALFPGLAAGVPGS